MNSILHRLHRHPVVHVVERTPSDTTPRFQQIWLKTDGRRTSHSNRRMASGGHFRIRETSDESRRWPIVCAVESPER